MSLRANAKIASIRRAVIAKDTTREVVLGNVAGQPDTDEIGYHWARFPSGADSSGFALLSPPFRVKANPAAAYVPRNGRRVFIKKVNGIWTVQGASWDDLVQAGIDPRAMNPNDPYRAFRYLDELVNLNSYDIGSGLLVSVREWQYHTSDHTVKIWQGTDASNHFDLTPYLPASVDTQCYVLVYFNITEHIANNYPIFAVASTPITTLGPTGILSEADLQECYDALPTDDLVAPIKAYVLEYGQTTIAGRSKDLDVRQFINVPTDIASLSPLTTKGDLFTFSTVNTRLPVGTNGQVLTADSAEATGLKWDTGSGSGAPFVDTTAIVKGSADATKLLRFEVDGFTTATTRVLTPPNYDGTIATLAGMETLSGKTLTTPVIADFTNAQHNHTNAAGGGQITDAALSAPVGVAKGGSGADMSATGGANFLLKQTSVGGAFTAALMVLADIPNLLITGAKIALATIGLTNLANGTPFRYMGWDSTGAAAELDGALDVTGDTGESWVANDNLYLDSASNTWFKIDTNAVPPKISEIRGVALTAATHPASGQRIRREGIVTGYSGLTPGAAIYASTTAGGYTQTKPTVSVGGGQIVVCEIGYAITATTAFIDKDNPIEYLMREWLSPAETAEIIHHSDPEGRTRQVAAYIASNTEVIKYQYTDSDTDAPLRRRSTGSTVTVDAAGVNVTTLGDVGGTDFRLAQQFEVTTTGYASTIAISTSANTGVPSVFPSYRIETNNATLTIPSGSVVSGSSGTLGAWTASGTTTITYAAPGPYLVAGVKYWLILELSAMQATNVAYTVIRNTGGGYANGVMKWDSTTGASFPGTWAGGGGTNDLRMTISTVVVNDALAQGLTISPTIDITRAELYLKRTGTFTTEVMNVELWIGVGAGAPLTLWATSDDVLSSSVGTSAGYVNFPFLIPVSTSIDTEWYIVLTTDAVSSATKYIDWLIDTSSPGFSGGVFKTLRSTTWADNSPAADGRFILYGVGTYYDVPIVVGLGSTVLEAHYGDASFADQDTTTTFESAYGVIADVTMKVKMG